MGSLPPNGLQPRLDGFLVPLLFYFFAYKNKSNDSQINNNNDIDINNGGVHWRFSFPPPGCIGDRLPSPPPMQCWVLFI